MMMSGSGIERRGMEMFGKKGQRTWDAAPTLDGAFVTSIASSAMAE